MHKLLYCLFTAMELVRLITLSAGHGPDQQIIKGRLTLWKWSILRLLKLLKPSPTTSKNEIPLLNSLDTTRGEQVKHELTYRCCGLTKKDQYTVCAQIISLSCCVSVTWYLNGRYIRDSVIQWMANRPATQYLNGQYIFCRFAAHSVNK